MSINIKDPETDRLARDLAAQTGESITQAVKIALKERLKRESAKTEVGLADQLMEISRRASKLPRLTNKTPDEILGYDDAGLPT